MRERGFRYAPEEKIPFPVIYLPHAFKRGIGEIAGICTGLSYCRSNCGECQASCFSDTGPSLKEPNRQTDYPFPKTSASVLIFDKTLPEQIKPADNSSAEAQKELHFFLQSATLLSS